MLHGLAYFYAETGDPARAAPLEARYAEKAPRDRDAFPRAVDLYLQARQAKPAIALAGKALALEDRADVHELLGQAYEMDSQPENAAVEMRQAIKLNAYDESYYFRLAPPYLRHQHAATASKFSRTGARSSLTARNWSSPWGSPTMDCAVFRMPPIAFCAPSSWHPTWNSRTFFWAACSNRPRTNFRR